MSSTKTTTRLSRTLSPEDVQVGDYIGLLQISCQYASFNWICLNDSEPEEPVRVTYMPQDGGVPLKVKSVCLPFLLVKAPDRPAETIDVRQCQLARLDRRYARRVWKALKPRRKSKK